MDLQSACEILEELSDKDAVRNHNKLNAKEFLALQVVLLELQVNGMYKLPEKYSNDVWRES
ncbi:hypothetical protein M3204_14025 [Mesobacillus subterraneus]|uniref:hypothetical protein n=1 Tax=Mesobacillus subterraneus TaxID=285983 RepID=UPI00203AFF91|nr:hypothetical protein [Mesobacillus subterraneus]MCM3665531.1 hypothetical protein [Mesobacillus subterraneus]MCM3686090.1 hypothetical protein [Mesobacillus subterraneus]